MSFSSNFIKRKGKQWHYYPYGTVLQDVSMPIKEGEKNNLEGALNNEMQLALMSPVIVVGIGALNPWLLLFGFLIIPYFGFLRRKNVRTHCEFIHYPFSIFIKNYFKIVYFYIDEKNHKNRRFLGFSSIAMAAFAYGLYVESAGAPVIIFMATISILGLFAFILMYVKYRISINHNDTGTETD